MTKCRNILIAGIGGQGVSTLSVVLQRVMHRAGLFCNSSIFKGGAQKRGSVYSTIRVFGSKEESTLYSSAIANTEVDLVIALEANEALRFDNLYNDKTHFIVNNYKFPFYNERYKSSSKKTDPIEELEAKFENCIINNYNEKSKIEFGNDKMMNVLIGREAIIHSNLGMDEIEYLDKFQQVAHINYEDMLSLMKLFNIKY